MVALQLSVQGSDLPILVTNEAFAQRLVQAGLDPVRELATPPELISDGCVFAGIALALRHEFGDDAFPDWEVRPVTYEEYLSQRHTL